MAAQTTLQPLTLPQPHNSNRPQSLSHALTLSRPSTATDDQSLPDSQLHLEERDDYASSETTSEPTTPTDMHHPDTFERRLGLPTTNPLTPKSIDGRLPVIVNTAASPPGDVAAREHAGSSSPPKTPTSRRSGGASKDGGIKRALSGLFRRSNSHHAAQPSCAEGSNIPTETGSEPKHSRRSSFKRLSTSTTPYSTRSNTPPSPRSPADTNKHVKHVSVQEPTEDEMFHNKKKKRASTGLTLRERVNQRASVWHHEKQPAASPSPHRAISVDDRDNIDPGLASDVQKLKREVWVMPALNGHGLKARRMSQCSPHEILVEVVDLYSEYQDQSWLVGKRGKHIGTGATASVKLMLKKGRTSGEVYAVKEFRGKSSTETADEYEKKVKSEYTIAHSLHHPNIVETFHLCTYNGRWNQVMEFCDQGDLFSLVQQKYLNKDIHAADRICFFKQLIAGIHYLHENGIAHRDIKLENLLVTKEGRLKITDFGVSEVFSGSHPGLREAEGQCGKNMGEIRLCEPGMCGSPPYVAPEVLEKKELYDPRAVDVWGAAIVMLNLCAGGALWPEARLGSSPVYDDLLRGWKRWNAKHGDSDKTTDTDYPFVSFFDNHIKKPALRRLLVNMLNPNPKRRFTIREVHGHRWLSKQDCCQVEAYGPPAPREPHKSAETCRARDFEKIVQHNHLPPQKASLAHRAIMRAPGATDM